MQRNGGKSVRGVRLIPLDLPKMTAEFEAVRPAGGGGAGGIDNPWPYENRSPEGMQKNAAMHYPCMSIDDICRIPVGVPFARDAAIFSYNVWPLMPHWMTVIEAWRQRWGFEFAGLAWEWIKYNAKTGKYAFGPGYGTRKNLEPCLLLTRGEPSLKRDCPLFEGFSARSNARSVRDFIEAMPLDTIRAKRREHSRKPEEGYERVEQMFDGPYVDIFSRTNRPGWVATGNEIGKFAAADEEIL